MIFRRKEKGLGEDMKPEREWDGTTIKLPSSISPKAPASATCVSSDPVGEEGTAGNRPSLESLELRELKSLGA